MKIEIQKSNHNIMTIEEAIHIDIYTNQGNHLGHFMLWDHGLQLLVNVNCELSVKLQEGYEYNLNDRRWMVFSKYLPRGDP